TSKRELLGQLAEGRTLPARAFERISTFHAARALAGAELAGAFIDCVELELHGGELARDAVLKKGQALAQPLGLDWNAIFPPRKRVLVGGVDVAAKIRAANLPIAGKDLAAFIEAFIDRLPPRTSSEHILQSLASFRAQVDETRRQ